MAGPSWGASLVFTGCGADLSFLYIAKRFHYDRSCKPSLKEKRGLWNMPQTDVRDSILGFFASQQSPISAQLTRTQMGFSRCCYGEVRSEVPGDKLAP